MATRCTASKSDRIVHGSGVDVYEGMIIGENARNEEMDVQCHQREETDEHEDPLARRGDPTHSAARADA